MVTTVTLFAIASHFVHARCPALKRQGRWRCGVQERWSADFAPNSDNDLDSKVV
jgi:hypothetical protein